MYASFLRISRALHLEVFEQPAKNVFFHNPPDAAASPQMTASGQL
jgi:hypothetical protein